MPVVLLTGFEPFAGDVLNPSQALVQALDEEVIRGWRVVGVVLPCAFAAAPAALEAAIVRWQPGAVLALGQAGGRTELSIERLAVNLIDARIADNAGQQPIDVPVIAGGPAAYFSTLPVKPMVQALRAAGLPAGVSYTAGTFVCNQVFYVLQHLLGRGRPGATTRSLPSDGVGGFMHVPLLPEQAAQRPGAPGAKGTMPASLAFEDMLRGVRVALDVVVESAAAPADSRRREPPAPCSEGRLD